MLIHRCCSEINIWDNYVASANLMLGKICLIYASGCKLFLKSFFVLISNLKSKLEKKLHVFYMVILIFLKKISEVTYAFRWSKHIFSEIKIDLKNISFYYFFWFKALFRRYRSMYMYISALKIAGSKSEHLNYLLNGALNQKK